MTWLGLAVGMAVIMVVWRMHSPDHHDYGHSNGQSKPSHYFSLMISVQNAF